MNDFWAGIDRQLAALRTAKTADEVIDILEPSDVADAFFAGSGGDDTVEEALDVAGWSYLWREAHYYWAMRAPNGDVITYIEGDVYRGNKPPARREE